jgi:hypothetical protein
MTDLPDPITPETENALQQSGGPLQIAGLQGKYVVMRLDVYDAMLGISNDGEAQTLADVDAGRTHDADEALQQITAIGDYIAQDSISR